MEDNTLNAQADLQPTVEVEQTPQVASDLVQAQPDPVVVEEESKVEQAIKAEPTQKLKKLTSIDPERIKNLERNGMSKAAAEMYVIQEEKRKMQQKAEQEAVQSQEEQNALATQLQELDNEKAQVAEAIADAEEVGIDASNLRSRLEEIESEREGIAAAQGFQPFPTETLEGAEFKDGQFVTGTENPQAPADRQDVIEANATANQVSKEEVDQRAEEIKQQQLEVEAQQQAADSELQRQRRIIEEAQNKLAEEDLKLQAINPDRYWNNRSTGQKILAAIGMMLGGAPAANIVQQQIDADINAQKLSNQQKLAKRAQAIKIVNSQIDRLQSLTNDQFKQQRLDLAKQQFGLQLQKINAERLQLAQAEANKRQLQNDLSQGKLKDPSLLNKEDKERVVRMRDGSIQLADNKKASEDVRKFQAEVEPAIKGAHRILKISEESSRLNLADRARIATDLKALVGQLRIPFTGPGVLTDKEYDRLLDTIGDPSKLFALPSIERTKIKTVINKLSSDLDMRYKQAGVNPVKSKREKLIDLKLQQKAGSRQQIEKTIDSLIQQGKLSTDYEAGM